jgi:hypothetical protein
VLDLNIGSPAEFSNGLQYCIFPGATPIVIPHLIGSAGRAAFIVRQSKRMETVQMKGMNFDFSFGVKLSSEVFCNLLSMGNL